MYPSIDILNTTDDMLEFQKGGRLHFLTPGLNTIGSHEWPFAQRALGDRVRLAPVVSASTPEPLYSEATDGGLNPDYVPEPEAVLEPEPEPETPNVEKTHTPKKSHNKGK